MNNVRRGGNALRFALGAVGAARPDPYVCLFLSTRARSCFPVSRTLPSYRNCCAVWKISDRKAVDVSTTPTCSTLSVFLAKFALVQLMSLFVYGGARRRAAVVWVVSRVLQRWWETRGADGADM